METAPANSRTPPKDLRDRLRREVNFGCPICRSPFLTFHHFDPPWEPSHVHNEPGMIALCPTCHNFADGGSFSIDYLKQLKANPPSTPPSGRLPWNSASLFIMFGGNYFISSPSKSFAFRVDGSEVFSLRGSDYGCLSINAALFNASGELVCKIDANDIIPNLQTLGDLTCSTQGKEIKISSHANEAMLSLRYERYDSKDLLDYVRVRWPKSSSPALKKDKTEKVRGFIETVVDSDGLCPVIKIRADVYSVVVPTRTLSKGIVTDFRPLGYDVATLTGLDAGESSTKICYSDSQQEMLFIGGESA